MVSRYINNNKLRAGVSGIMRVKNDAELIGICIDSCISALDELIIVYNDCSDETPRIIEEKRLQYPDKIRVYEYKHRVYSICLSKEDFDYANGLPDDSPHLLCNYYNFALSKVTCKYAVKIDADQLYFTENLKKWCDVCRTDMEAINYIGYIIGFLFNLYLVVFKQLCFKFNKVLPLMPLFIVRLFYPFYIEYAKVQVRKGQACLSLSGINVIKDNGKWFVSLGGKSDLINVLPPFNGEGDHLIFRVSSKTYYEKFTMPYYNLLTTGKYSLIENFVHPYKILCVGFCWFHLNAMRERNRLKVLQVKAQNNNCFIDLLHFVKLGYKQILSMLDYDLCTNRQRTLFAFIYKCDRCSIGRFTTLLNDI